MKYYLNHGTLIVVLIELLLLTAEISSFTYDLTFKQPDRRLSISGDRTTYTIVLGADIRAKYSISLALTSIECPRNPEIGNPVLKIIPSDDSSCIGCIFYWSCIDINEEKDWQGVKYKYEALRAAVWSNDVKSINITTTGQWYSTSAEARLIVSIYYDTNDECAEGEYNCNVPYNLNRRNTFLPSNSESRRCIPSRLKCNGEPNCGMLCNSDETVETCKKNDGSDYSDSSLSVGAILGIVLGSLALVIIVTVPAVIDYRRRRAFEKDQQRNAREQVIREEFGFDTAVSRARRQDTENEPGTLRPDMVSNSNLPPSYFEATLLDGSSSTKSAEEKH